MNNADGYVIIGTDLDTNKFDKKYIKLKNEVENSELDLEVKTSKLEDAKKKLQDLSNEMRKIKKEQQDIEKNLSGKQSQYNLLNQKIFSGQPVSPQEYLEFDKLGGEIDELFSKQQKVNIEFDKVNEKINKANDSLVNAENQYNKQIKKVQLLKEELQQVELQQNKIDFSNINKSLDSITKKIVRWGLAVFGVRSAYMAIRSAINTIANDDEQLKADIDGIKAALAYTIEPLVRGIVNLAKQLMGYIAYIVKAWTGRDIFAKANKSLASANKSAKELQKTSASFDKFNKLSGSGSSGGAGGGAMGLATPEDVDVPTWIKWIAENKDIVIAGLVGIAAGLVAIKFGADLLMGLGIGLAITGIVLLIQDIIKFIKDPSWENFANILRSLSIVLAGVAIAMLAVNAANPIAWIMLAIAAIGLLISAIIKNWDKIKEVLGTAVEWIKQKFSTIITFFSNLISKIVGLFKTIGTKVGDVIGSAFKTVINGVLKAVENILNTPIKTINKLINKINDIPGINLKTLSTISLPRLAKGGIVNMPGSGINYAGANIAERGLEGIVPLTDNAQMELLGKSIGKHVKVNVDFTAEIEGRVFARVMKEINAENQFARNGG